jgi:dihydropteroate synthase
MKLEWSRFCLDFSQKTHIMGILNVTPDSFSDGGLHFDKSSAVNRALRMAEEGADIIDIGGESSRPGAEPVSIEEETRRTIPVIEALAKELRIPISIDTYKSEVAKRAIDAGAAIVNDISGLRFDPEMPGMVAAYQVPVVIMHIRGTPKNMQKNPTYQALIPEILDYLRDGIGMATDAGISEEMIIVDPGIGFGKTFEHNLEIINNLRAFTVLRKPVLTGPSRKAFIGKILGDAPAAERLEGTIAAVAVSIMNGANIVRVHDVREMAQAAKVADAIKREKVLQ